jgi:hypothetical protein
MGVDIRPLHRALKALTFTTPLPEDDVSYVARPDELGQQILNRIMAPSARRLLVGGPVGCGKSTELLQIHKRAHPNYAVVLCPCELVRHPVLDGCASVFVVPLWTLYGRDSMELYPDVEVLRIQTNDRIALSTPSSNAARAMCSTQRFSTRSRGGAAGCRVTASRSPGERAGRRWTTAPRQRMSTSSEQ